MRHKVAEIWKKGWTEISVLRFFPLFILHYFPAVKRKTSTASFITLNPRGLTKITREVWNFFPVKKKTESHTILGNWRLLLSAQLSADIIQALNEMLPNGTISSLRKNKKQEKKKSQGKFCNICRYYFKVFEREFVERRKIQTAFHHFKSK